MDLRIQFLVCMPAGWPILRRVGHDSMTALKSPIPGLYNRIGNGGDKIVGVLSNLGIKVSDTSIDNIRKRNRISLAPERKKKRGLLLLTFSRPKCYVDQGS